MKAVVWSGLDVEIKEEQYIQAFENKHSFIHLFIYSFIHLFIHIRLIEKVVKTQLNIGIQHKTSIR